MTVKKRNTSKGISKYYNYRFRIKGKLFYGSCYLEKPNGEKVKCTTELEAKAWEANIRSKALELGKQKSVRALVENFRNELTGGNPIGISEAFELSLKKPRKRTPAKRHIDSKRAYWNDFSAFMESEQPECTKLSDVRKNHAEEYIQYIRTNGRYEKTIVFKRKKKTSEYEYKHNFSNKTCNAYQIAISEVFKLLNDDAGLIENPFDSIPKLDNKSETREAFTEDELQRIAKLKDPFIYPLFAIGITTALREGDICTLKWKEIDFEKGLIRRQMLKTGKLIEIPIMQPLNKLLVELKKKAKDSEYVLPFHAGMYKNNSDGISWRVKSFLETLEIKTTKKVKGRTREVSIKDVHSLRHTFCYLAGVYGIPFLIVKDICGHVSPEMTELYQRHATIQEKRKQLEHMPDFMGLLPKTKADSKEKERTKLIEQIQAMPMEKVLELLQIINQKVTA